MTTARPYVVEMKGDGFYDSHSQVQSEVIKALVPLIQNCVASIPAPDQSQSFCIVDYGCSEGKNSVTIVHESIIAVRQLRPSERFFVVHDDLPSNNFNQLFSSLYYQSFQSPETPSGVEKSTTFLASKYGATPECPVYVFASASSFYLRVVPDNFVHLGISSSSVHWTSSFPSINSHIFHSGASESENAEYAKVAAQDWQNFLGNRADELTPGGKMVVTLAARVTDDCGEPAGPRPNDHEQYSAQSMLQLLNDVLKQMVVEKLVDQKALERFGVPIYCRSKAEIVNPITEAFSDRLHLEHFGVEWIQCPFHAQFKIDGDAAVYAKGVTGILRAFTESSLAAGLFGVTDRRKLVRDPLDPRVLIDIVYERVWSKVSSDPDRYTFYPCHATVIFSKIVDC